MKKIGFVMPWYGENISGGAEMELREVAAHLSEAGADVEILSTCIKDAASDWSVNFHSEGTEKTSNGVTVRRFRVEKRNTAAFDAVNAKLMKGLRISVDEEDIFLAEMMRCPSLYSYMKNHSEEYSLFVFIPYLLGTTYNGAKLFPEKSVLIPCFHDEGYAYISRYKEIFPKTAGMIFNARPEAELAERLYGFSESGTKTIVMGIGMDMNIVPDAEAFRSKFDIDGSFIIYAGRKDEGKNVHTLVKYFAEYIKRRNTNLKLVLIGGGSIELPTELVNQGRIIDLGFVDLQDKYNGQAAAEFLCQPSRNESFSLVIMESWLCCRPVLVHSGCAVTKNFASESNGGLYFGDYFEFEGCTDWFLNNKEKAIQMGENGRNYVRSNFAWDVIVDKYMKFFREVSGEKE
ncbi:glycosyltransferase family 4 protein [Ruminococcus sp.]|uniref:glycosyltransferase family 4 protein n=1 Tax=Ruminococcus sp. TaxID=41978 RepID=UPI0025E14CAC|nr:glycosyltransferase family 4 protein [Ruminococcus sp.]MBO4523101.1 glycosyltransferase family 4 protein [Ruminococcus sp.]